MREPDSIEVALGRLVLPQLDYVPQIWPPRVLDLVAARARAANTSPAAYLAALLDAPDSEAVDAIVASATTPHTSFFRHPEQFERLRVQLLDLYATLGRPLHLWSAGCATGEEPYSMAVLAQELALPVHIRASDISRDAIAIAKSGTYPRARLPRLPGSTSNGSWQAPETLQRHIDFRIESLLRVRPATEVGTFDVIFCRNVAIYFAPARATELLAHIAASLAPWGFLVVAPTDALVAMPTNLERLDVAGWLRLRGGAARRDERPATRQTPASATAAASRRPPPQALPRVTPRVTPSARDAAPAPTLVPHTPAPPRSLEAAARALASGDADGAERVLRDLLDLAGDDTRAWFLLGETLVTRGQSVQARAAFLRVAATARPNDEEETTLARASLRRAGELGAQGPQTR